MKIIAIEEKNKLLCESRTGWDILNQEMIHLKHVRPLKLDSARIRVGLPILLQDKRRAEIVDIEQKKVYLYDEGE